MPTWTRKQNWEYNSLLGRTAMAKTGMRAVRLNPATSDRARKLAQEIETQLNLLDRELRANKRKAP